MERARSALEVGFVMPYVSGPMLLTDTAKARARSLSAISAGLSVAIALMVTFGMNDGDWMLIVPVVASIAATAWPTRLVVAVAMTVTGAVVVLGMDGSGVLFGASAAILMLALNSLQSAATRVRPVRKGQATARA